MTAKARAAGRAAVRGPCPDNRIQEGGCESLRAIAAGLEEQLNPYCGAETDLDARLHNPRPHIKAR